MTKIISALRDRGNWCWLLGHKPESNSSCRTESDLFNAPNYKWCRHCSRNMGEV